MEEDKIVDINEIKEFVKDSEIKLSDLIVSKDNMLEAMTLTTNRIIDIFAVYETDSSKVSDFKNAIVSLVKLSQDAGAIQLMLEALTPEEIGENK